MTNRNNQYAVINDGIDYRTIATSLSKRGCNMNHSSARNYVLRAMKKIVIGVAKAHNLNLNDSQVTEIAKSQMFQQAVGSLLDKIQGEK